MKFLSLNCKNLIFRESIGTDIGIGEIVLNKPPNTLDVEILDRIMKEIPRIEDNERIKVVIITGQGKSFCAGANIKRMKDMSELEAIEFSAKGQDIFRAIETMSKPVIAAVNGYAFGGGCELALACDWIYAAESAQFGQLEIKVGITPGWGATWRLPERVGMAQAKELIFTGEIIDAREAHRIGLVNKIFPNQDFMDEVEKVAKELAGLSPLALRTAKEVVGAKYPLPYMVHSNERVNFARCFGTHDQKEGMNAFLEKREANFKGK